MTQVQRRSARGAKRSMAKAKKSVIEVDWQCMILKRSLGSIVPLRLASNASPIGSATLEIAESGTLDGILTNSSVEGSAAPTCKTDRLLCGKGICCPGGIARRSEEIPAILTFRLSKGLDLYPVLLGHSTKPIGHQTKDFTGQLLWAV